MHPLQPALPGAGQPQPDRELRGRAPRGPRDRSTPDPDGAAGRPAGRARGRWRRRPGSSAPGWRQARGHRVERGRARDELGGVVRVAAAGAGRSAVGLVVDWLVAECRRLGVHDRDGPRRRRRPSVAAGTTAGRALHRWPRRRGRVRGRRRRRPPYRSDVLAADRRGDGDRWPARRAGRHLGSDRRADRRLGRRAAGPPGRDRHAGHARPDRRHAARPHPATWPPANVRLAGGRGAIVKRAMLRGRRRRRGGRRGPVHRRGGRRSRRPRSSTPATACPTTPAGARDGATPISGRRRVAPRSIHEAVLEGRRGVAVSPARRTGAPLTWAAMPAAVPLPVLAAAAGAGDGARTGSSSPPT